jgi:hypothetical protein
MKIESIEENSFDCERKVERFYKFQKTDGYEIKIY